MADDVIDVTLVTDTNAYADNDVLVVPQKVVGFFTAPGGTRRLKSVVLLDEADQAQDIDLLFLNADATLGTINAAVSMTDADARKVIGAVSLVAADYVDLVNGQVAVKQGLDWILKAADDEADLWIGAVCRSGTPTYAASSLKLKLGVA